MAKRRVVIFLAVLGLTLLADQGTKAWARTLPPGPQPVIAGYWDWDVAYNDGAAFSNFRGKTVVLSLIAIGALAMIGYTAVRAAPAQRLRRVALAIIAGGALGNLIDRLREGAVTDFVFWHVHDHRWPVFNVADVALVIGVGLLMIEGVTTARSARVSA
jgi:signal peptidase II